MEKTRYHIRSRPLRTDPSTPRTQKIRHRPDAHHAQTFSQAGLGLAVPGPHWKLLAAFLRSKTRVKDLAHVLAILWFCRWADRPAGESIQHQP